MRRQCIRTAAVFVLGVVFGIATLSLAKPNPSLFVGKAPEEAARELLKEATVLAGQGTWERIAVGRVYYLMGDKAKGQEIFDGVTAGKIKNSDWIRISRVYFEANEWDKAESAFLKALALKPKDAEDLAEMGAYYNLHGDRQKAEEMFTNALQENSEDVWITANIAGSYVGVRPQ
jgi:tetratricopeptide (TPR) repeat protein